MSAQTDEPEWDYDTLEDLEGGAPGWEDESDSLAMKIALDECYWERYYWEQERLRLALEKALMSPEKVGQQEGYYDMPRWVQYLYILKAALCLGFDLKKTGRHGSYPDTVDLAEIYSHRDGYGWSAAWAEVGHGLFRNWFINHASDGDSFL